MQWTQGGALRIRRYDLEVKDDVAGIDQGEVKFLVPLLNALAPSEW